MPSAQPSGVAVNSVGETRWPFQRRNQAGRAPAVGTSLLVTKQPKGNAWWRSVLLRSRWLGVLLLIFVIALASIGGCTTTIIAPANPPHPVTILVTDYGKHSSLLLPDPHGGLVEYAFGDWYYFARGHDNLIAGIIALIHSSQSTLGRRWVMMNTDAPYANQLIGAERTQRLIVDADKVDALRHELDLEYARHIDSEVFNDKEHFYFVKCDEPYNLFHNCNNVTAQWLRKLGARTDGPAMFSRFRVAPAK
jgi:hypothetical protein